MREPPLALPAVVQPQQIVNIMAPIEGTVEDCFAAEGQQVAAGQVLARLASAPLAGQDLAQQRQERAARERSREADSDLSSARIEAARADEDASRAASALAGANSEYQKQKTLFQNGVAPRLAFENAERAYLMARADSESLSALARQAHDRVEALSRDALDVRRTVEDFDGAGTPITPAELDVRAPAGGIVIVCGVQRGDEVDPHSAAMFGIATDLHRLDAMAQVPPAALHWLRPGLTAAVEIPGPAANPLRGIVREVDSGGRILVGFESQSSSIVPGTRVRVILPRPSAP